MNRPTLITAGATRNPLDAIRYISAFSTGRTGVSLANALVEQGAVHFLGSAEACLRCKSHPNLTVAEYTSTRNLMEQMLSFIDAHPDAIIVHAAAVGDYEIAQTGQHKIPSGKNELILRLTPTPKIIDHLRPRSRHIKLVSFKAASPETTDAQLHTLASRQRARTGSDLVFANVIGRLSSRVLLCGDAPAWHDTRTQAMAALIAQLHQWQNEEQQPVSTDSTGIH